jgi:antitoxin component YwqK of YwqJK toxin-antitoxin module
MISEIPKTGELPVITNETGLSDIRPASKRIPLSDLINFEIVRKLSGYTHTFNQNDLIEGFFDQDGKKHGPFIFYQEQKIKDENGVLKEKFAPYKVAHFEHGQLHGKTVHYECINGQIEFDKSGSAILSSEIEYNAGKVTSSKLYEHGILREETQKINSIEYFKMNFPDGSPREEGFYQDKKRAGQWKFFKDRQLTHESNFQNDLKHGTEIIYNNNGEPKTQTEYKNGLKEGTETLFDKKFVDCVHPYGEENEVWTIKQEYKRGERTGVYQEILNGKVMTEGQYLDGERDGTFAFMDQSGNLISQKSYSMGLENKPSNMVNSVVV